MYVYVYMCTYIRMYACNTCMYMYVHVFVCECISSSGTVCYVEGDGEGEVWMVSGLESGAGNKMVVVCGTWRVVKWTVVGSTNVGVAGEGREVI